VVLDGAAYLAQYGATSHEPLTRELSALWELVFGDAPAYTSVFFESCFRPKDVLLWAEGEEIRSMLFLLPASIRTEDGSHVKGRCLYAGATHPAHRGKGYFRELFREADCRVDALGERFLAMHPAEDSLYDFYRTLGYETAFTCTEMLLPSDLPETDGSLKLPTEEDFVEAYSSFAISRENVLLWDRSVLPFLYRDAQMEQGSGFAVQQNGKSIACGIFCQPDENTILIKDIASSDWNGTVSILRKTWKKQQILLRLPQKTAENWDAGAVSLPFGMIKYRKEPFDGGALLRTPGFMGAVLD